MINFDPSFFTDQLYPLQDKVLQVVKQEITGFYLTGGTALARGYLFHRFSDDLDFFTNLNPNFGLWCEQVAFALSKHEGWQTKVTIRQQYFMRIFVQEAGVDLKLEFVNDVPSRVGDVWDHPTLGRIDTLENMLANKLTAALNRRAAKDIADIWAMCVGRKLSIPEAITGAQSKAAGIYPVGIAEVLFNVTHADWEAVRWIAPPDPDQYICELKALAESLILME